MRRNWTLGFFAVTQIALSACELFGYGAIACNGSDQTCPTDYFCGEDKICRRPESVTDDDWQNRRNVDAPLPVAPICSHGTCGWMPDSLTATCYDTLGNIAFACPNPTEHYHGQDSNYRYASPEFDHQDGVVRERTTGLWWQETLDLRDVSWQIARDHCRELALANLTWRLPLVRELVTLLDYGRRSAPRVDASAGFVILQNDRVWARDSFSNSHWYGDFSDGRFQVAGPSTGQNSVLCVSGDLTPAPVVKFVEGHWFDDATELEWQVADADSVASSWEQALLHCESSTAHDRTDWRLPSIKEFETLFDRSHDEAHTAQDMRNEQPEGTTYWTSTPRLPQHHVLTLTFGPMAYGYNSRTSTRDLGIRCVRGRMP